MPRIIHMENHVVEVEFEDGTTALYELEDCNYQPIEGDRVKVFKQNGQFLIVREDDPAFQETVQMSYENPFVDSQSETEKARAEGRGQHVVNKYAYGITGILLGGLGVHEFMVGNNAAGVASILFCWTGVPEIIGLAKGIKALVKKADEEGNIVM